MSFSVNPGIRRRTPGRLMPLCDNSRPPTVTRAVSEFFSTDSTCSARRPSSSRSLSDGCTEVKQLTKVHRDLLELSTGRRRLDGIQADDFALRQLKRDRQTPHPDLRALQILKDTDDGPHPLRYAADGGDAGGVFRVRPVREIQARHVHARPISFSSTASS